MKFLKFLGWSIVGLVLLAGLAYGLLPTIASRLITQELTNRGFTNVEINIDRPGTDALTIPSLAFHTPTEYGSNSIIINNAEITYSLHSLWNRVVDAINIEHIRLEWDSSLLERPATPSPSLPPQQTDSPFPFTALGSEGMLPVLPFQHFHIKHLDISNPLAPPALKQISLNMGIDALPKGYEGFVHIEGEGLLLNHLTFSLTQDGSVSFSGFHTRAPEDPVLELNTSLRRSASSLKLQGKATLKLHPIIHTLAALYPLAPEYQSVTGTFSGTWTGTVHEQPSQAGAFIGPIQGDFTLDAHMPRWPPFAQDIKLLTHGTFSMEGPAITVVLQPSSAGNFNLSLGSLIPPALTPFISHKGLRSFAWNIQQPVHAIVPITSNLDDIQIPTGKIHIAMHNASEQLDLSLSPKDLRWQQSHGIVGHGDMSISTHIKPATTPSLRLETISLKADVSLALLADQIQVTLNPPSLLRLANVKNETLHIPTFEGRFPKGLSWAFHTKPQTWELQAAASTIAIPSISLQGKQWKLGKILTKDLMMTAISEKWMIKAETSVTEVRPPKASFKIPPSNWQTRYSVNPASAAVQFNGQTLEHPLHVSGQIRLNLLTGEGSGTLAMKPIQFAPQTLVLSQLIQPWPFPDMEVTHGTVSASAEGSFEKTPTKSDASFHLKHLHGIVHFDEMGGFFKPTILQGLTTRVEILGKDETLRIPRTPFRIRNIQSAVELTKTSLLFSTGTFHQSSVPTLSITNAATHLLGGKVSLADTIIDPSATTHAVTLQVRGLDLGEVLRLEQQEAVKGTGTLDGTLPLSISGKEVTVKQGSIQGRSPGGTLQFHVSEETASSWAKSQPNLDLIVKSLENYQYSKLVVGVDYEKNGILNLATQLEGKNPDFRNGVPIHFNLNIEENIPALMKSLSLVKDLENKIETMLTGNGKASAKKKDEPSELQ